jgi:gamma-butyrobetaine dioxygenase/trimethyllysine dioxygenase
VSAAVDPRRDFLRLRFAGGAADFHWFWLRHLCPCCVHPQTRERTVRPSDVPLDVRPARVALSADGARVEIDWSGHASVYPVDWLRAHAYAPAADELAAPPADATRLALERAAFRTPGDLAKATLERVATLGAAVVRGAGLDTEAWIDAFAAQGLVVIPTHFGRIEDLRTDNTTNRNTDQLGYTDAPVDLHTDQPFLDEPPRYQMLHCMRPAEEGGENAVADARAAAEYLRRTDAEAFEQLATVPIDFHRTQQRFEKRFVGPLLELDADGGLRRVRSSYFTMAPQRLPFARMEAFYRALQRWERLVTDPCHHWRFRLDAGDFLFYDNWRVLHARTSFRGARWVRGVYFDPEARR